MFVCTHVCSRTTLIRSFTSKLTAILNQFTLFLYSSCYLDWSPVVCALFKISAVIRMRNRDPNLQYTKMVADKFFFCLHVN